MKFLVSHSYTHTSLPTKTSPHGLYGSRLWGDGVFILLVCFAEKSFKSVQIFEQREQSQTLLELCRVARIFAESKLIQNLSLLFCLIWDNLNSISGYAELTWHSKKLKLIWLFIRFLIDFVVIFCLCYWFACKVTNKWAKCKINYDLFSFPNGSNFSKGEI